MTITIPASAAADSAVDTKKMASMTPSHSVANSYISPKTRSVTVAVTAVDGAALATPVSTTVNTVAGTACSAGAGTLTCSISLDAPVGNDTFSVSTFAQAAGVGGSISRGDATALVSAGTNVDVSVTLLGVISSVQTTLSPAGLPQGSAGVFTATIVGKDVNGDIITGTDNYYQPLTVNAAASDPHVSASPALPATLASPSQRTITFTYDGGATSSYAFTIGGAQSQTVNYAFSSEVEHLYVAYQFPAAVYVYDIHADGTLTGPSRTIAGATTTLNRPTSIAVDDLGQLYVVNYGDFPNQGHDIAVYASGANGDVAPTQTLLVGSHPYYVSYKAGAFLTHPDPNDASTATVNINYGSSIQIPIGGGNGTGSTMIPPYIEPFANAFASYQASVAASGLLCTAQVNYVDNGVGYVSCITSPVEWVTGNTDPGTAQIVNGYARNAVQCCSGGETDIKFLEDGKMVVSQGPTYMHPAAVDTYVIPGDFTLAPSVQPVLSLTGANTHLLSPTSMAVDSHGNLYVGDTGNASGQGSVHVFAPGATGNVAPVNELLGLNYPFGIAIGK